MRHPCPNGCQWNICGHTGWNGMLLSPKVGIFRHWLHYVHVCVDLSWSTFVPGYFFDGQGISEAARYHVEKMELGGCTESDLADATKNPKYRTVNHWHTQWLSEHQGPRTGDGMIDVRIVYTLQWCNQLEVDQVQYVIRAIESMWISTGIFVLLPRIMFYVCGQCAWLEMRHFWDP